MTDLAVFLGNDESALTCLADELNRAMDRNPNARAQYERIYGVAWCALGIGNSKSYAASTTAKTVM